MTKHVVPLLTAILLGGCDGSDLSGPEAVAGHYTLVDVAGQRVPTVLAEGSHDSQCILAGEVGTRTRRINNGALDLGTDGSFEVGVTIVSICEYSADQTTHQKRYVAEGQYSLDDGRLVLSPASGDFDPATEGFVESESVTLLADLTGDGFTRSFKFVPES